jgi:hypothetical protein
MASKFDMDPAGTESGLSSADASAGTQPGSVSGSLRVGAYSTPLVGAILGTQAVKQASAEGRVVTNAVSREVSVNAVEVAEAGNSGALTT